MMAFTRFQLGSDGRTKLYFKQPGTVPREVWALRALVVVLALSSLIGAIKGAATAKKARTFAADVQEYMWNAVPFDLDRSIDGRYRYCLDNPDECIAPWGDADLDECVQCLSNDQTDLDELTEMAAEVGAMSMTPTVALTYISSLNGGYLAPDCDCRDLFFDYGWDFEYESIDYQSLLCNNDGYCDDELVINLPRACSREPTFRVFDERRELNCSDYGLWNDFTGTPMVMFLGKEVVKTLNITLTILLTLMGGVVCFIVVRYIMVGIFLFIGRPNAHLALRRVGMIQIGFELAKNWYLATVSKRIYSLGLIFSDGFGPTFIMMLIAIAAVGLSFHPAVQRHYSNFKYVPDPDGSGPDGGSGGGSGPGGPSGGAGGFSLGGLSTGGAAPDSAPTTPWVPPAGAAAPTATSAPTPGSQAAPGVGPVPRPVPAAGAHPAAVPAPAPVVAPVPVPARPAPGPPTPSAPGAPAQPSGWQSTE